MTSGRLGGRALKTGTPTSGSPLRSSRTDVKGQNPPDYSVDDLATTLEDWRRQWGVASDRYIFEGRIGSLQFEVVAALGRFFYEKAAADALAAFQTHDARKLAKLAVKVLWAVPPEDGPVGQLRARWRGLTESVREFVEEEVRHRRNVLPIGYQSVDDCVNRGSGEVAAQAIWSACTFGASQSHRQSRGTGKRRRGADLIPTLAFKTPSHRRPEYHTNALVRALGLICMEARGAPRARDGAFADLVARVFQIADIQGAAERVSMLRAAQKRKRRRPLLQRR